MKYLTYCLTAIENVFNLIAPFIAFINSSQKNFPRMFNISLILLFVATGYLLGQRYSSSFSVNPNLV